MTGSLKIILGGQIGKGTDFMQKQAFMFPWE